VIRLKRLKYVIILCSVLLLFIGCRSGQKELESIVITITDTKDTYTVTDQTHMDSINETLSLYAKMDGIVDMITPAPIELIMNYSDKSYQSINLYIYETDKRSSLTYAEDDSTIYRTTEKITSQLKGILDDVIGN